MSSSPPSASPPPHSDESLSTQTPTPTPPPAWDPHDEMTFPSHADCDCDAVLSHPSSSSSIPCPPSPPTPTHFTHSNDIFPVSLANDSLPSTMRDSNNHNPHHNHINMSDTIIHHANPPLASPLLPATDTHVSSHSAPLIHQNENNTDAHHQSLSSPPSASPLPYDNENVKHKLPITISRVDEVENSVDLEENPIGIQMEQIDIHMIHEDQHAESSSLSLSSPKSFESSSSHASSSSSSTSSTSSSSDSDPLLPSLRSTRRRLLLEISSLIRLRDKMKISFPKGFEFDSVEKRMVEEAKEMFDSETTKLVGEMKREKQNRNSDDHTNIIIRENENDRDKENQISHHNVLSSRIPLPLPPSSHLSLNPNPNPLIRSAERLRQREWMSQPSKRYSKKLQEKLLNLNTKPLPNFQNNTHSSDSRHDRYPHSAPQPHHHPSQQEIVPSSSISLSSLTTPQPQVKRLLHFADEAEDHQPRPAPISAEESRETSLLLLSDDAVETEWESLEFDANEIFDQFNANDGDESKKIILLDAEDDANENEKQIIENDPISTSTINTNIDHDNSSLSTPSALPSSSTTSSASFKSHIIKIKSKRKDPNSMPLSNRKVLREKSSLSNTPLSSSSSTSTPSSSSHLSYEEHQKQRMSVYLIPDDSVTTTPSHSHSSSDKENHPNQSSTPPSFSLSFSSSTALPASSTSSPLSYSQWKAKHIRDAQREAIKSFQGGSLMRISEWGREREGEREMEKRMNRNGNNNGNVSGEKWRDGSIMGGIGGVGVDASPMVKNTKKIMMGGADFQPILTPIQPMLLRENLNLNNPHGNHHVVNGNTPRSGSPLKLKKRRDSQTVNDSSPHLQTNKSHSPSTSSSPTIPLHITDTLITTSPITIPSSARKTSRSSLSSPSPSPPVKNSQSTGSRATSRSAKDKNHLNTPISSSSSSSSSSSVPSSTPSSSLSSSASPSPSSPLPPPPIFHPSASMSSDSFPIDSTPSMLDISSFSSSFSSSPHKIRGGGKGLSMLPKPIEIGDGNVNGEDSGNRRVVWN